MSGINLVELEASDMLDVLHYFFEDDTYYSTEIAAETKNNLRVQLYETMYKKPYAYASNRSKPRSKSFDSDYDLYEDSLSGSQAVKPFVPATDFDPNSSNPFGDVLDRPVGY